MKTNETNAVTEQKFKHGDKIKCIDKNNILLTYNNIYKFDKYNGSMVMIQGVYDDGSEPEYGEYEDNFELFEAAKPVKPKDDRKKYTLIHSERVGYGMYSAYIPRIKKIKVKDIVKYLDKTDLDVQYVIKGHVTLV